MNQTHRNSADSSSKPFASANTASRDPSFRSANMARYRSNSDNLVSRRIFSRSGTERSAEAGSRAAEWADETRGEWEAAGAGSMQGYWLLQR